MTNKPLGVSPVRCLLGTKMTKMGKKMSFRGKRLIRAKKINMILKNGYR